MSNNRSGKSIRMRKAQKLGRRLGACASIPAVKVAIAAIVESIPIFFPSARPEEQIDLSAEALRAFLQSREASAKSYVGLPHWSEAIEDWKNYVAVERPRLFALAESYMREANR